MEKNKVELATWLRQTVENQAIQTGRFVTISHRQETDVRRRSFYVSVNRKIIFCINTAIVFLYPLNHLSCSTDVNSLKHPQRRSQEP